MVILLLWVLLEDATDSESVCLSVIFPFDYMLAYICSLLIANLSMMIIAIQICLIKYI